MVDDGEGGLTCNFDAAEQWLAKARAAFESGDDVRCVAACRLVIVALELDHLFNGMPKDKRERCLARN